MKALFFPALATLPVRAACDNTRARATPILDGAPSAAFETDLSECQALACNPRQPDQEPLAGAVLGVGVGAALGAVDEDAGSIGAATGWAAVGGLTGGAAVAGDASARREVIVTDCLRGRGHRGVG